MSKGSLEVPTATNAGLDAGRPVDPVAAQQQSSTAGRFGFVELLRALWDSMAPRRKLGLVLLSGLSIVASLGQLAFAALLAAFTGAALSPNMNQADNLFGRLSSFVSAGSPTEFVWTVGIAIVVVSAINSVLNIGVAAGNVYFAWLLNRDLSTRLLDFYLQQDYLFFKRRNSADLAKNALIEVQNFCSGFVQPLLDASSRLVLVVVFGAMLIAIDLVVAVCILGFLVVYFSIAYLLLRRRLQFLGDERLRAQGERFKVAMELFSSITAVKLHHQEAAFLARYRSPTDVYCRVNALEATLAQAPRLFLETLAVSALVFITLAFTRRGADVANLAPILVLYSIAAYRLMPTVQLLFGATAQLRSNGPTAENVMRELRLACTPRFSAVEPLPQPLRFDDEVRLQSVSFSYDADSSAILHGISMEFKKGELTAICGQTGSGKSTLIDLIVGLITPGDGDILVDGKRLGEKDHRAWKLNFGYVPQEVVLLDASLKSNIAFGFLPHEIDDDRVVDAARLADIHDFIASELPKRYDTEVGERGSRLSGGQRQRIGIARALYRNPEILLLDEATSALDAVTEARVIENIRKYRPSCTVIAITHRLSSIRNADRIHLLSGGRVVASGTYEDLRDSNAEFQALALERAAV